MREMTPGSSPATKPGRSSWRRVLRAVLLVGLATVAGTILGVLALRFVPPPATAFMVADSLRDGARPGVAYDWVPARSIAPGLALALVAAEDQKFPVHSGFDLDAIGKAWDGGGKRGASTISQQVAKNLFLWRGRSWVRKGLEAYFTVLVEALWPKRRILEVYMNVAQFGPGVYGAEAAARTYFRKSAASLTRREAALLAAVLPNPVVLHVDRPSAYVMRRVRWIERQASQLGPAYLKEL